MEAETNLFDILVEKIERYFSITVELTKLKSLEKSAIIVSFILSRLALILMLSFFILFCSLGLAVYLGELCGKIYYGFFIVSAVFLVLALLVHLVLFKLLLKPVSKVFIEKLS